MHTPIVKYDFGDSFSSAMVKSKQEKWRKAEAIRKEASELDMYKKKLNAKQNLQNDLMEAQTTKHNAFMSDWYAQLNTVGPYGAMKDGKFVPNYDMSAGIITPQDMWKNIVTSANTHGIAVKPGDFKHFLDEYNVNAQLRDEHMIGTLNMTVNDLHKKYEGMNETEKKELILADLDEMGLAPYMNRYQSMFSTEDFIETFKNYPPENPEDVKEKESYLESWGAPSTGDNWWDAGVGLASWVGYKRLKGFMGPKYESVKKKFGWGSGVKPKTEAAVDEVKKNLEKNNKVKGDVKSTKKKADEIINKALNLKKSDVPKGTKKTTLDNLSKKLTSDKINLTAGENKVLKHLLQTNKSPSFVENVSSKITPNPTNPVGFKFNYRRNMDVFDNHIKFLDKTIKGLDKRTISYKNMVKELDDVRSMKYSYKQLENIAWKDRIKQNLRSMSIFGKDTKFGKWLNKGGGPGLHMLVAPGVVNKVYEDSFKESGGNEFKANWDASLSMMMFDIPLAFQSKGLINNLLNYGGPKLATRLGISTAMASSDTALPIGDAGALALNSYWIAQDANAAIQTSRIHNYYKKNGVPPEDVINDLVEDTYDNVAIESLKADYNPLMWQNELSVSTVKDLLKGGYDRQVLTDENGNTKSFGLWIDNQRLAGGNPAPVEEGGVEFKRENKFTGRNPEFDLKTGFYSTAIESSEQKLGEFDNAFPGTNQLAEQLGDNPPDDIKQLLEDKYGDDWHRVWQSGVGYIPNPYAEGSLTGFEGGDHERALELFMNQKWNGDLFKQMIREALLESFYQQPDYKAKNPKQWKNKANDAYNKKLEIIKQLESISGEDIPDTFEERIGS